MADVYGFEDTVMEVNNTKAIKQTCGHQKSTAMNGRKANGHTSCVTT